MLSLAYCDGRELKDVSIAVREAVAVSIRGAGHGLLGAMAGIAEVNLVAAMFFGSVKGQVGSHDSLVGGVEGKAGGGSSETGGGVNGDALG